MLKAVELNREVTIAQFQEELDRLRLCVAQRDRLEKELRTHKTDKVAVVVPLCVCVCLYGNNLLIYTCIHYRSKVWGQTNLCLPFKLTLLFIKLIKKLIENIFKTLTRLEIMILI